MTTLQQIKTQQKEWAKKSNVKLDSNKDGYVQKLDDNLFLPLPADVEQEFRQGQGDELGTRDKKGNMFALHSSSALVVNFFLYWRIKKRINDIAEALRLPSSADTMQFEQIFPTGLEGNAPEPDILFTGTNMKSVIVESKFTETYQKHTVRRMKNKYVDNPDLWKGLSKCYSLAKLIKQEEQGETRFTYLDAPQLLKHILGLTKNFGKLEFELIYLWYEVNSDEALEHKQQIHDFREAIWGEVHFRELTYQQLFAKILTYPNVDSHYFSYLSERYFMP